MRKNVCVYTHWNPRTFLADLPYQPAKRRMDQSSGESNWQKIQGESVVKSRAFKRWVLEDSKRPKTETLGVYKCIDVYIYINIYICSKCLVGFGGMGCESLWQKFMTQLGVWSSKGFFSNWGNDSWDFSKVSLLLVLKEETSPSKLFFHGTHCSTGPGVPEAF